MQNFVSAVIGGLVVGAVLMFFAPEGPAPGLTEVGDVEQLADQVALRRLDELDDRLRELEAHRDPAAKPRLVRTPVKAAVASELRTRVHALETELADLRERISLTTFELHRTDDPDEGRRAIEIVISGTNDMQTLGAVARVPMRVGFLEQWPRHEHAPHQLSGLIDDYLVTQQRQKAMAAIDRFGPKTGLPTWDLDAMRLRVTNRDTDRIEIARRVARSRIGPENRAWAMYELAHSLSRSGRDSEALATIDAMVGEFANTKAGRKYVGDLVKLRKKLLAR